MAGRGRGRGERRGGESGGFLPMNFNAVNKLVKLHGVFGQRSFFLYYSPCPKKKETTFTEAKQFQT
jgi:hypothetical protein